MKIVTAVYSHPEYYPPTLNALNFLSSEMEEVFCVHRNVKTSDLNYQNNIKLVPSGAFKSIRASESASFIWKLFSFLKFTLKLWHIVRKNKPYCVLLYDPFPFLSYQIIKPFLKNKPKVWYHNHDVVQPETQNKISIGHLACINEKKNLPKVDIFSLPSNERKLFFNLTNFTGRYFFIPNYPSINKIKDKTPSPLDGELRLIYQGHIGEGHGLEEIIRYIAKTPYKVTLNIVGIANDDYKNKLIALITMLSLTEKIKIHDFLPYDKLLLFTGLHHVGLAIHEPINIAFITAVTASNKIYEYMAHGMPVLLYNSPNYRQKLSKYNWAKLTDLSYKSLENIFNDIISNYYTYSNKAIEDYKSNLNFEHYFINALNYLKQ